MKWVLFLIVICPLFLTACLVASEPAEIQIIEGYVIEKKNDRILVAETNYSSVYFTGADDDVLVGDFVGVEHDYMLDSDPGQSHALSVDVLNREHQTAIKEAIEKFREEHGTVYAVSEVETQEGYTLVRIFGEEDGTEIKQTYEIYN